MAKQGAPRTSGFEGQWGLLQSMGLGEIETLALEGPHKFSSTLGPREIAVAS